MMYRIDKGTPTFALVAALMARADACFQAAKVVVEEVGGLGKWFAAHDAAAGGISGIQFAKCPDGWKGVRPYPNTYFFPKKTVKTNAPLLKRIHELPMVITEEFNAVVGFKPQFTEGLLHLRRPALFLRDDYALLKVHEEAKFAPNADMVEITMTEFQKLKGGNE